MVITTIATFIGNFLVLAGLGTAAAWDLSKRIIPNALVMTVGVGGLLLRLVSAERHALWMSAAAAGFLFFALLPLAKWGTLGGGDAKLITATAVGQPPASMFPILLGVAVAGGLLAVFCLIHNWTRNRNSHRIVTLPGWQAEMPYAPAILAGVLGHELWGIVT